MKLAYVALALAVGCKSPSDSNTGPDGNTGKDGPASVDAQDNTGWTTIAARSWTLAVGEHDKYECTRVQIPADMYITGFRSLSPVGTHHSVLTYSTTATPLGDYDCSVGALDFQMIYAAGLNTDDLLFPTNIAMKVPAGQYVNLNIHLFNASDNDESGMSGVLVKTITAAEAANYTMADMTFAGNGNFTIPAGQTMNVTGGCNAPNEWHIFDLWPHMHMLGTHQKVVIGSATPLDTDYSFAEQRNYPQATVIDVPKGTPIQTTCTFTNTTTADVSFGESSTDEMCFTGLYKYPAGGNLLQCVSNFTGF